MTMPYVAQILDYFSGKVIIGNRSYIVPGEKLRLIYNDGKEEEVSVFYSSFTVSENPTTGQKDVTIKMTLDKDNG